MWCLRVRRWLSALVDDELDPQVETRMRRHLGHCGWCRRELDRVRAGAELAVGTRFEERTLPPPRPSMLSAILATPDQPSPPKRAVARPWRLAAAASLALALGLVALKSPARQLFWPFGSNSTVHALDFGIEATRADQDLLDKFRARYAGKFREFRHQGPPDPAWVPYSIKSPAYLPPRMQLRTVMIFDPAYCGSLLLNFGDGSRNLYLLQQPADRPISLTGLKTTQSEVCKYNATHSQIGPYSITMWTADETRWVIVSNLTKPEIESVVTSLR